MQLTSTESPSGIEPAASPTKPEAPHQRSLTLPDRPLVTIEASKSGAAISLKDLWNYRELLYFLMWRDLKVRYRQTALGVAWVIMQPLMATLIFTLFLGNLANIPSDGIPYPIFVYSGLLPWTFFSGATLNTSNSLVGNSHLITKVYFPRMIIPAAAVGARLVDFIIAFVIFACMMVYYRVGLTWGILMLPVLIIMITLLAFGFGMLASALNVRYRDVGAGLPMLIQLLMFASPIIYPSSLVPGKWRLIYALNPLTGIIEGFRASLLGHAFNWPALGISGAILLILITYAAYLFQRMEESFADIV